MNRLTPRIGLNIALAFALLLSSLPSLFAPQAVHAQDADPAFDFTHLTTANNDLPIPSNSTQQTSALILDVDNNGVNDFVIASRRTPGPSLVWYRRTASDWERYVIDSEPLLIEAGGDYWDIDGDGDLDIVMGGDSRTNQVWWWENPAPSFSPNVNWTRRLIKNSGEFKHHDQMFGDFTGDDNAELVFWNQYAKKLYLAEIPADPQNAGEWPLTEIYSWSDTPEHEGLAKADIDGDGLIDIVGGGRWFKYQGGANFDARIIDDGQRFGRAAAGQLIPGGYAEVVLGPGDNIGPLEWYRWDSSANRWNSTVLISSVERGHSLRVIDFDQDGHLDIFVAEMRLNDGNPDAKMRLLRGDGQGNFSLMELASGIGNHESRVGDLDGDGDMDILGKPYNWETPRLDIWLSNLAPEPCTPVLNAWQRHVIDADQRWTAIFVDAADLNGDELPDIVAGGDWYENPGTPGSAWTRRPIGDPLNNMAAVYDFDGDGDADILGTAGKGSDANPNFYWAQNNGSGTFMLGQGRWGTQPKDVFDIRLRTTETDDNGRPAVTTPRGAATTQLTHVAYARSANGAVTIYINGTPVLTDRIGGTLDNWDSGYRLALAGELDDTRHWLGELHLIAIYCQALDQAQVEQNFSAGP